MSRPKRIRIINELGKPQSLADEEAQFIGLGRGERTIILGLGPAPSAMASLLPAQDVADAADVADVADVAFVECPDFEKQMPPEWSTALPRSWARLTPEDITPEIARTSRFVRYRPALGLFPGFWGPILARIQWALLSAQPERAKQPQSAAPASQGPGPNWPEARPRSEVWIPTRADGLLIAELESGLSACGFKVRRLSAENVARDLPRLLARSSPALYLSVNFAGLDALGESYHLLRASGAQVAVWCVDNPFHLLSGLKAGWWRQAALLVTDDSFMPLLGEHGAQRVFHLPLAAWPEHFAPLPAKAHGPSRPDQPDMDVADRLVFVGRSRFPQKQGFFAGLDLPGDAWRKALGLLEIGERPDFLWWRRMLGVDSLWPGSEVRRAGLGADEGTRELRGRCLRSAAHDAPLTVFGDSHWREAVPEVTDLRPQVDYYGPLRDIYAQAGACLNVTSLLLPAGLTQRHFDVWMAGGVLITDATPGLAIFPEELCREMRFRRPQEIGAVFRRLTLDSALRADLGRAWKNLLLVGHTYQHRMERLLNWLELHARPQGIDLPAQGG